MVVLITALIALFGVAFNEQSASAAAFPPGKTVVLKNADVLGRCGVQAFFVNPLAGYATTLKLGAHAQPAGTFSGVNNVFTQAFCFLYDASGTTLLASIAPFANGSVLQAQGKFFTVEYQPSYVLCGFLFVKLSNGNSSTTPEVCG